MNRHWLFDLSGEPAFYITDSIYLHSAETRSCDYYIAGGYYVYDLPPSAPGPRFYVKDGWVYDMTGKPAYYFGPPNIGFAPDTQRR